MVTWINFFGDIFYFFFKQTHINESTNTYQWINEWIKAQTHYEWMNEWITQSTTHIIISITRGIAATIEAWNAYLHLNQDRHWTSSLEPCQGLHVFLASVFYSCQELQILYHSTCILLLPHIPLGTFLVSGTTPLPAAPSLLLQKLLSSLCCNLFSLQAQLGQSSLVILLNPWYVTLFSQSSKNTRENTTQTSCLKQTDS